jgi:hypothetical protein
MHDRMGATGSETIHPVRAAEASEKESCGLPAPLPDSTLREHLCQVIGVATVPPAQPLIPGQFAKTALHFHQGLSRGA